MPSQPTAIPPERPVPADDLTAFAQAFYNSQSSPMGVLELRGDDFLFIAGNLATARYLGVPAGEIAGKWTSDVGTSPTVIQTCIDACREAERSRKPVEVEYERRDDSGTRRLLTRVEHAGCSEAGAPRFTFVIKDVTDHRRRLEEAHRLLRERALERRATEILQSITDGFYALDRDFRFTFVNQEAEKMLQRSREELLGRRFWDAFPETLNLKVCQVFERVIREQVTCELEEYYPPLDALFTARIYPSADGLSVYFRNITQERKLEAELAAQHDEVEMERRRLQAILDILPVGVFITDATGQILRGNQVGRAIWGYRTPASASPDTYSEDYPAWRPDTGKRVESDEWSVAQALATGKVTTGEELLIEAGDGRRKTILNYALPVRDSDGALAGAVAVNVDITDRKRMEEALRDQAEALIVADRAKDEFLAMLGHELRNPLGTIACATELLRRLAISDEECEETVEILQSQVRHMARLLDDLLEVSRITTGRLELRREVMDLNNVALKAVEGARPVIEAGAHLLSVSYSDAPVRVHGDAARLRQVLGNLLNNAARYTPPGGRIWLTVEAHDGQAVVRVRDNGEGIAADLLPRIFDVFSQGQRPLDRAPGGLGIGLTLVRRLVEMHGGCVEARSDGPCQGSEFIVRLPTIEAPMREAIDIDGGHRKEAGYAGAEGGSLRVLVVEDHPVALRTLAQALKLAGHTVDTAMDGLEALQAARRCRPDAVLLDIGLPEMDGYEVARQLRGDPAYQGVLLIALTGYGQESDREKSRQAGIDTHLLKPVDFARLEMLLAQHHASTRDGADSHAPTPDRELSNQ